MENPFPPQPKPGSSEPHVPRQTSAEAEEPTDRTVILTAAPNLITGPPRLQSLQENQNNTWLNSQTCGWFNGTSSLPLTCDKPWSCVTDEGVVTCHSYPWTILHSVCLDYQAHQLGKCTSLGGLTGCCSSSNYPACITYLWTEPPSRSRLACGKTSTVFYMNDRPQFIIDAESSAASSSSSPSKNDSDSATLPIGSGPSKTDSETPNRDTSNVAAMIIGAAISSLLIIAVLIVVLVWLCLPSRRRHNRSANRCEVDGTAAPGYDLQTLAASGPRTVSMPARTTP